MLQKTPTTEIKAPPEVAESEISAILAAGSRRRGVGRYAAIALVAGVVLVGVWLWLASGSGTQAVSYTTAPVTHGDLVVTVAATGTVQPTNTVEVSSELSGTIGAVLANFNDTVKAGDTLAMLKTDKLDANVTLAQATVTAREADVRQATVSEQESVAAVDRATRLLDRGVITQEAFETATAVRERAVAALAVANANLETARANLAIAENERSKAAIVSPIDGVVLDRNAEAGQTVAAALQAPVLFTLAEDLATMQVEVNIDEADIASVEEGDAATFTVEAYRERTFPAAIEQVRYSPETIEGVVTYKAVLAVDNADLLLRPGMTAIADIVVEEVSGTLMVPNAALRYAPSAAQASTGRSGGLLGLLMPRPPASPQSTPASGTAGGNTVWVLRDGQPTEVAVEIGLSDGTFTAVTGGGLVEGDLVIVGARTAS